MHYISLSLLPLSFLLYGSNAQLQPYLDLLADAKTLVTGDLGAIAADLGVEATYDYVVIGGGTAGNTIGVRLAEAGHSVAIIEAGTYYEITKPILSTAPGGDLLLVGSETPHLERIDLPADWTFYTQPQAGANNREMHYARGKALGGSYVLNI
jgi:hypothetical protein